MNNILSTLLTETQNNVSSLATVKLMNAGAIANAYTANYAAALTIIRANDPAGLKCLNDKSHIRLNKFSNFMSRPNFWGFIIFNSDIKKMRKIVRVDAVKELAKTSGYIVKSRRLKLQTYTTLTSDKIDWTDAALSIKLLKVRFGLLSSKLDNIANGIYHWNALTELEKGDLYYQVFSYLQQTDNESNLLPILRKLTDNKYRTMNAVVDTMAQKIKKVFRIMEDESGGTVSVPIASGDVNPGNDEDKTTSKDIANVPQYTFKRGKIIKRKKRNWQVKKWVDPTTRRKKHDTVTHKNTM